MLVYLTSLTVVFLTILKKSSENAQSTGDFSEFCFCFFSLPGPKSEEKKS